MILLYFLFVFLPFTGFLTGEASLSDIWLNGRRLRLLANSGLLAFLSAGGCLFIGLFAALFIHNSFLRNRKGRWFFLLMAPVPYYIYALTWMYLIRFLGRADRRLMSSAMTGLLPCVFVNIFAFLPVTAGLILAAMEALDGRAEEMGTVYAGGNRVFFHIILPEILPALVGTGAFVFVLSITDYSVPSLFQFSTYTLEIFSRYSAGASLKEVGLLSLPLVSAALLLLLLMLKSISSFSLRCRKGKKEGLKITGGARGMGVLAFLLCILQIVIPVSMFLLHMENWSNFISSVSLCAGELLSSLVMAALAAVTAVLPASFAGTEASKRGKWYAVLLLFPMAVPSSLIGMGLLRAVNGSAFHALSRTVLFPAFGCAVKYMPFAAFLFAVQSRRIAKEELELGRIYAPDGRSFFWNILLPAYRPALLGSLVLVFVLALGEESIALILMPPGCEMLAVKVYNYLHYGASELVSGFSLLTVLVTGALFFILFEMLQGKRRKGQ